METAVSHGGAEALTRRRLCEAAAIVEGAAKGFVLGGGTERRAIFVLRCNGELRAFENSCPHLGTSLEVVDDQFFDGDGEFLLCRTHGALFRPADGFCVEGPCAGQSLSPARIAVADGVIWLEAG